MTTSSLKGTSVVLGIGLAILWIAGLSSPYAPGWLTWLDGVGALCAFIIAGSVTPQDVRSRRMAAPIALSIGLYVISIIGLATGALTWLSWWTFAFACAFLITGIAAGAVPVSERPEVTTETELERERREDRFRRTG